MRKLDSVPQTCTVAPESKNQPRAATTRVKEEIVLTLSRPTFASRWAMPSLSADVAFSGLLGLVVVMLLMVGLKILLLRTKAFLVLRPKFALLARILTRHMIHTLSDFTLLVHVVSFLLNMEVFQ
ncbi:hypothetical protein L2E82_44595 [Cichorium intybus]|uniref:Uncharacterized protein n=1 Tax=Cichorium intybus TaxID=13427 RepID=A0ACB8ZRN3_CICIN|nr:hypothetical protein L2E82_44595 [Cichorium intybus]